MTTQTDQPSMFELDELATLLTLEFEGPERTPVPLGTSDTVEGLLWFTGQMTEYCKKLMLAVPPKYRVDADRSRSAERGVWSALDHCRGTTSVETALGYARDAIAHARTMHQSAAVDRSAVRRRLAEIAQPQC